MSNRERVGELFKSLPAGLMAFCLILMLAGAVLPSKPVPFVPIALTPAEPVRLVIPDIDLRAEVIPIKVDPDGVLEPPEDFTLVGWWDRSAKPGAETGQTVITGHTVNRGGGVMDDMPDVKPGATVRVRTPEGTMVYEATRVVTYSIAELAENAQRIFGQGRTDGRLVLITCTDFENGAYQSNLVVYAHPVEAQPNDGADDDDREVTAAAR